LYQKIKTSKPSKTDQIIQQNLALMEMQKEDKDHQTKWSVGGQAGPQYSYRDVTVNTINYPLDDYDSYEKGMLAYAGGFNIEVEPVKRIAVQTGLYYSKIGNTFSSVQINNDYTDISTAYFQAVPDATDSPDRTPGETQYVNSTGNIGSDKNLPPPAAVSEDIEWIEGTTSGEQYFEFVELPLIIKYRLIDKKLDVNISGGLWANVLVGNKYIATDKNAPNEEYEDQASNINTFSYSGSLGLDMGYPLTTHLVFSLEPFFKYYLTPLNSNPETEVYPYTLGILSGVKFYF
jgi:hypothetical protein